MGYYNDLTLSYTAEDASDGTIPNYAVYRDPRTLQFLAEWDGEVLARGTSSRDVIAKADAVFAAPADALVNAVLNETLSDLDGTIYRLSGGRAQGEPDAASERRYFEAQRRAYAKAQYHHLKGVPATWTGEAWLVPSSSRAESIHRVSKAGDVAQCSCEAGASGRFCWHAALASAVEVAHERADVEDVAPAPAPELERPIGARLAQARAQHTSDWF